MAGEDVERQESVKSREMRVLEFWKSRGIFHKSEMQRQGRDDYVFYEGPPTANGLPHPGHVLTRVYKDLYLRYKTMKGFHVVRKGGWDTHGLPVEIEVEKKYGINGKRQIEEFGVEKFIRACRDSVFTYEKTWRELTERLGYWIDLEQPYMTLDDNYIESVWNLLKRIFDKGLLVQGHRVSPYCPHCETTLSSHEVAQGYVDVKELSVTVKFRVADVDGLATYLLAWTTTPWTLPSNVAVAVNPELDYILVRRHQSTENVWVAERLKDSLLETDDRVVARKRGAELIGMAYDPVFPFVTNPGKKHLVIGSSYVTADSGTGIVHMAPAHGDEDYRACTEAGILFVNFVDSRGCFTEAVKDYRGRFVKDEQLNLDLVRSLGDRGLVFNKFKHEHAYPHCWRCDTPLIYYAVDSWFVQMTAVKDQLLRNSNSVNWIPDHIRAGRMGNFLENILDWNLSRTRYWGTPLPIWRCTGCGRVECIGSKAELRDRAGQLPSELHKPYIDVITWPCTCHKGRMERVSEVIDVWFDSGSMPFAQLHYPFENIDTFERLYPADYICEAIDQTRGWFYSLLAISTIVTGQAPYKNALVLGHVLDETGKKMSKSKGNVIDPLDAFDQFGADALRFYFVSNTQPWNNQLFYFKAVALSKSKFLDLLQNVYHFYRIYANIDDFKPDNQWISVSERPVFDRWLLSRMNQTIKTVDSSLSVYDANLAARVLQSFVEDLSTWYVRRNRERFWASGTGKDKTAAFLTLHEALKVITLLTAPLTPFLAEEIYQDLTARSHKEVPESVHLCDFPVVDTALIDDVLMHEMSRVKRIVEVGRRLRNESQIKTRQPLAKLYLSWQDQSWLKPFVDIIQDELNIKTIEFTIFEAITTPTLRLKLDVVGKALGAKTKAVISAVAALSTEAIRSFLDRGFMEIEGVKLTSQHLEVFYEPNFEGRIALEGSWFVGLTTRLSDELREEGMVRDMISAMQSMRKTVDYGVTQQVHFYATGDPELLDIVKRNWSRIGSTVLAPDLPTSPTGDVDASKELSFKGKTVKFYVTGVL